MCSLAVGLLFVYLSTPPPTVIYVYPTPDNLNDVEYQDKADSCFQFVGNEVKCNDKTKIIPVQS
jgi:hypothetical protein